MVEWKKMWELTAWDKKFQGVEKSMQSKIIPYTYLLAKDLFALAVPNGNIKLLSTGVQEGWTTEELAGDFMSEGEVVTIPWGKSPGAQNPVKYYKGKFVTGDNRIATSLDTNVLNNKFLYYWMYSNSDVIETFYRGAGIQHPSMFKVLTMPVPLLSISEQNRIVGILDTFTASIDNLKEQITQRRKQFEHYRDQLLDFEGKEGIETKMLRDIAEIKVGPFGSLIHKNDYIKGGVQLVNPVQMQNGSIIKDESFSVSSEMAETLSSYLLRTNDIVFARRGEIGRCAIVTEKESNYICGTGSLIVRFIEKVNSKYMLFMFCSPLCKKYLLKSAIGGSMLNINCDIVGKMIVPIPSLTEQSRIVSILDTFEASIANLEAQLSQREKQYEYYRNKLLTFD